MLNIREKKSRFFNFFSKKLTRSSYTPTTRFIFAGDSNIVGGYAAENFQIDRRALSILGLNPYAYYNTTPININNAVSGQRIAETKNYLESLTPNISGYYPEADIKIIIVGTGTNDFYASPPASYTELINRFDLFNDFYKSFPNFYVLPITTLQSDGFISDIANTHTTMMTNWSSYGWDGIIDGYRIATYTDTVDYQIASPLVHVLDHAHVKWSWLIAAAISKLSLSNTGTMPDTYFVLDGGNKAANDALYTAVNNAYIAGGFSSQSKIENSDGIRNGILCPAAVLKQYGSNITFQNDLHTAFGSLHPLNQLIDAKTMNSSVQLVLPTSDGWP